MISLTCGTSRRGTNLCILVVFIFALQHLVLVLLTIHGMVISSDVAQDVAHVIAPFNASIGHTIIDLGSLTQVAILRLLSNLHRTVEVLCSLIEVALLRQDLSELHECATLALTVLELTR